MGCLMPIARAPRLPYMDRATHGTLLAMARSPGISRWGSRGPERLYPLYLPHPLDQVVTLPSVTHGVYPLYPLFRTYPRYRDMGVPAEGVERDHPPV